ncbi:hypothetical protein [Vibrio mangrovi]|uniref:Uncharacterized protein n=1 Tax=Vibrio mangrovi TaxID=474394 RepID=A0A1Y6IS84_9VIBR|nr:hypothetical protein [Vibrio mangrovi]MDW6003843.1 hypothetical protein [Vibrio mangrovi]SMR99362.1 hypothetical protein VIM7927_00587 [Vibrio mangrovi]
MNTETQAQKQVVEGLRTISDNFQKAADHLRNVEKNCREAAEKLQQTVRQMA